MTSALMWDAVDPFARSILTSSGAGPLRDLPQRALGYATTLANLPKRVDELAARIDRGQAVVRTPDVDRRLRSLERAAGRVVSAVVFAALLFAGILLLPHYQVLGWVLMAAAVPLVHVVVTWW